jgi:hypothetical protein
MFDRRNELAGTVLSGIDLAIDFATLGEYGLEHRSREHAVHRPRRGAREPFAAVEPCRELSGATHIRPGRRPSGGALAAGWEALFPTKARRGACRTPQPALAR